MCGMAGVWTSICIIAKPSRKPEKPEETKAHRQKHSTTIKKTKTKRNKQRFEQLWGYYGALARASLLSPQLLCIISKPSRKPEKLEKSKAHRQKHSKTIWKTKKNNKKAQYLSNYGDTMGPWPGPVSYPHSYSDRCFFPFFCGFLDVFAMLLSMGFVVFWLFWFSRWFSYGCSATSQPTNPSMTQAAQFYSLDVTVLVE